MQSDLKTSERISKGKVRCDAISADLTFLQRNLAAHETRVANVLTLLLFLLSRQLLYTGLLYELEQIRY